ncbi:MAG: alpha/beta fold hydrolase [Candidatus Heimdallarchaeota archaeon]|nr:alpha/beta fold hydrolase [Candidatus Heimdallarchaeota archaeon]
MVPFNEQTDYFKANDGTKLFYRAWLPKRRAKKEVFIGIHGAVVHSGNMKTLGEYFAQRGYPFYAFDQRGQGHCKEKRRGHMEDYRQNIEDIKTFREFIQQREKSQKYYLVGHSMGGAESLIFAIDYPSLIHGVLVSSPAFKLKQKKIILAIQKVSATLLAPLFSKTKINHGIKPRELVHDPHVIQQREKDPLVPDKVTINWTREFFRMQAYLKKNIPRLTVPTFFMIAGDDRIVDKTAAIKAFDSIKEKEKMKLKVYQEHFHENFNEPFQKRQIVFQDMEDFIQTIS